MKKNYPKNLIKINGVYYIRYSANGKSIKKSLDTGNERTAIKKRDDILAEAKSIKTKADVIHTVAQAKGIIKRSTFSLDNIWKEFNNCYLSKKNILLSTQNRYKYRLDLFLNWFTAKYPDIKFPAYITNNHINEFAETDSMTELAGKTYNDTLNNLQRIFEEIKNKAGIDDNPFNDVRRKAKNTVQKEILTDTHVKALFGAIKETTLKNKEEYELLYLIGLFTGARLIDVCLMEWNHINFYDNIISYTPRKTKDQSGKTAIVPILDELKPALNQFHINKVSQYVLPNIAELYLKNRKYVIENNNYIFKTAGIKDIEAEKAKQTGKIKPCLFGYHSCRYYFATFCARKNIPIKIVMDATGHSKELMNLYYQRFNNEDRQKAFGLIGTDTHRAIKKQIIKLLDIAKEDTLKEVLGILKLDADLIKRVAPDNKSLEVGI